MEPFHLSFLKSQLEERKNKNKSYSLRAFAGNLQIDPSALSRVLLRKDYISLSLAEKIVNALKVSDSDKKLFLDSVASEKKQLVENRVAQIFSKAEVKSLTT